MHFKREIFGKHELESFLENKKSCVILKESVIDVLLLPYYLNDVKGGLWTALYRKLKKYDSKVQGILLGYKNIKVDMSAGRFYGRNAAIKYSAVCNCYVFQPVVGQLLEGVVNKISPDHIGCLVHKYFNVTIKRPEEEDYEHWNDRCINFNDKITFKVKELDYTGLIPYIEGEIEYKGPQLKKMPSSESGIEDVSAFTKYKKRKRAADNSVISSTQLPGTEQEGISTDSGLDFDFISPIVKRPKHESPVKKDLKHQKRKIEYTELKSGESNFNRESLEGIDHNNTDDQDPPFKKSKVSSSKKAKDADKKDKNQPLKSPDVNSKEQGNIFQVPSLPTPKLKSSKKTKKANDKTKGDNEDDDKDNLLQQLLKNAIGEINTPDELSPKKKKSSNTPNGTTVNNSTPISIPKKKLFESAPNESDDSPLPITPSTASPFKVKSPLKRQATKEKSPRKANVLPVEDNTNRSPLTNSSTVSNKSSPKSNKKNSSKSPAKYKIKLISPKETADKATPVTKTKRTKNTDNVPKSNTKLPKEKKDPAKKKIEFYLKKIQELAGQSGNDSLLENMLKSSLGTDSG